MAKSKEVHDQNREGVTISKLIQLFRLFLPKNTETLARLDKFSDLDIEKINQIKSLNIKGIILDADDCIAYNHGEVLKENIAHLKKLSSQGIKIVIYSNMKKTLRYESIEKYAKVLTNILPKPDIKGFREACEILNLPFDKVVMVGDNYVTDSGSLKLGIPFIKIKPIASPYTNIANKLFFGGYKFLREFYDSLSRFYDLFRKKPLTSKNIKNYKLK